MREILVLLALFGAYSSHAFGQHFDVASVKPSPPLDTSGGRVFLGPKGGPETEDPGRYSCTFCDISELVSQAYDVPEYRLSSTGRLSRDRFHIVATIPASATRQEFRIMLQNLLADRFTLRTHREMRDMQMCRLLRSAGGPKLKAHVEEAVVETKPGNRPPGFYYKAKAKTVTDFAKVLEGQLGKPVVDATGLAGTYDFDVWWGFNDLDADGRSPTESPTMLTAIRALGLKLESYKGTTEMVIVDHVQKMPTEN